MRVPVMLMLLLFLFHLGSLAFGARALSPASNPSNPPEIRTLAPSPLGPAHAPFPSKYHGPISPPVLKHHRRIPNVVSPSSFVPPQSQECDAISCPEPLTSTPIGSPCGCVFPIRVVVDLRIAPYLLFTHIAKLEVEVAAGTFLKQSQVKIMAVLGIGQDQQNTRVTIYLVPLGEKFDHMTALLIYERFWQKKVLINMSNFGNYEVIDVNYPGFPSSPPSAGPGLGDTGNIQFPFIADIPTERTQNLSAGVITVIVVASVIIVLGCFITIFLYCKVIKLRKPAPAEGATNTLSSTKGSDIKSITSNGLAGSLSVLCVSTRASRTPSVKTFSLLELENATDEFSSKRILGEGGFGRVYHGIMEDGNEVAIKFLKGEDQNGNCEFIAEVEMLSRLHHRNLVKLIGVCIEGNKRCLVYELVRNGSVESHLHGADKKKGPLDWDARIKIALGAARGLAYLHEDSNPCVIHRDFKASNILLEEDYTPKVTDFGLAREASERENDIYTRVVGTFGYVAPEYAMTGHLTLKSDVYSYGIVLLELVSGREPVYVSESQMPVSLATWARPLLTSMEGLEQLIDPSLHGNSDFNDVARVAAIASKCIRVEPSQRPFMGEVVQALKLVYKEMDETCEDSHSQRGSSSCRDYDYMGDGGPECSWWRDGCSPNLFDGYVHASPFMTMEYSLDSMNEMQRPHSTSLVGKVEYMSGLNRSGPLRNKRKTTALYGLRGSMSELGHLPWHRGIDGRYGSSL